jgi:hypothetical protein
MAVGSKLPQVPGLSLFEIDRLSYIDLAINKISDSID